MADETNFEAKLASEALMAATRRATESMATFSGWLMAASGAAFSLVVVNLEKMQKSITTPSLKVALGLAIGSLAVGTFVKLLTAMITAGTASLEDGQKFAEKLGALDRPLDLDAFSNESQRGMLITHRWVVRRSIAKAKAGDIAAPARFLSKLSQASALLTLLQALGIIAAGGVIAGGLHF